MSPQVYLASDGDGAHPWGNGSLDRLGKLFSMLTCLICGGDMRQDTAEVVELLREHGCIGTTVDSGGREFQFADGEQLEVGGMCNACDENEIRKFLAQR